MLRFNLPFNRYHFHSPATPFRTESHVCVKKKKKKKNHRHIHVCHVSRVMCPVGTRMSCSFKTLPGAPNDLLCEFLPGSVSINMHHVSILLSFPGPKK